MKRVETGAEADFFGRERIGAILLKIAPPVMLAQLIQAMYNIVDSFFVGRYSENALTALSVVFPMQLIAVALAVGTGVGVNTYMARKFAQGKPEAANEAAGTGMVLELLMWFCFAVFSVLVMRPYVCTSARTPEAIADAVTYGNIVCAGSVGVFLEGNWSKVHQARGNMRLPMIAQIVGAVTNIILDPLLIFGAGFVPGMGVAGAAAATVCGQAAAAAITGFGGYQRSPEPGRMLYYSKKIYAYGYPSILMQALYTVYIVALNVILAGFSDAAVTVLGLYYKLQSFFFIPLAGFETCIVPILSFNYARKDYGRCRDTMKVSFLVCGFFMAAATAAFVLIPRQMLSLFSDSAEVQAIGMAAFPIIGVSFLPAVFSLITPVFFQAIGDGKASLLLSLTRQIFCLIPIFWLLSLLGLPWPWGAFPLSELITGGVGLFLYQRSLRSWNAV